MINLRNVSPGARFPLCRGKIYGVDHRHLLRVSHVDSAQVRALPGNPQEAHPSNMRCLSRQFAHFPRPMAHARSVSTSCASVTAVSSRTSRGSRRINGDTPDFALGTATLTSHPRHTPSERRASAEMDHRGSRLRCRWSAHLSRGEVQWHRRRDRPIALTIQWSAR